MKTIRPDSPDQQPLASAPVLFLAGSIDEGRAEQWQSEAIAALSDLNVTILNPRRDHWNASLRQSEDEPDFVAQVDWELDGIALADVVLFHFSPSGPAPISLLELGIAQGKTIVVSCPQGYWRRGNVERLCKRAGGMCSPTAGKVHESLEDAIRTTYDTIAVTRPVGRTHAVHMTVAEAQMFLRFVHGPKAGNPLIEDSAAEITSLQAKALGVLADDHLADQRAKARGVA